MRLLLFLLRRLLWLMPVLLVVTFLVFFMSRILPGDPVYLMVGAQEQTDEIIALVRHQMGLDKPLLEQYVIYMNNLLHGDLGVAWHTSNPVTKDLLARFPATAELTFVSMFISIVIGIPLGVAAAVRKDSALDHFVRVTSLTGLSLPTFWAGLVAIYLLCFKFEILPTPMGRVGLHVSPPNHITGLYIVDSLLTGNSKALISSVGHIILPALITALGRVAGFSRMVRTTMLEVLESNYIRAARAYGIPDKKIYYSYALKNTLIPTVTHVGAGFFYSLGGSVIIETIFAWPGIGLYATESIFVQDYVGVQGVALLVGILCVLIYITVDVLYFLADPRVEY